MTCLTGAFSETELGLVRFPEIQTHILETICQYCYFKLRYSNSPAPIPEFKIAPEHALELLMAANYLDC